MIIKFIDSFLRSSVSEDFVRQMLESQLEEHILENYDLDLEHFLEVLEDTDNFEIITGNVTEFDMEYTQDEVDDLISDILQKEDSGNVFTQPEEEYYADWDEDTEE